MLILCYDARELLLDKCVRITDKGLMYFVVPILKRAPKLCYNIKKRLLNTNILHKN